MDAIAHDGSGSGSGDGDGSGDGYLAGDGCGCGCGEGCSFQDSECDLRTPYAHGTGGCKHGRREEALPHVRQEP